MPSPASSKQKCSALIVEDDALTRKALAHLLRQKGHAVATAETVGDALLALRAQPSCIILDLMLPDGHGVTVLRRVRHSGLPARVAIVTGVADPFSLDEITDLKPDAVFEKPVDMPKLLRWVSLR